MADYPTTEGMIYPTMFGINSHARTATICALGTKDGSLDKRTLPDNEYGKTRKCMEGFPKPAWGACEAGRAGYVPARELSVEGITVTPIAPSKTPTSDDTRNKENDKNDAAMLARNATGGNLSIVWVPSEEAGGLRETGHAPGDPRQERKSAHRRVTALLCRHGHVWDRRTKSGNLKKMWTKEFWAGSTR